MTAKTKPFLLMCRTENIDGVGGWIMVEADDVTDGDAVAQALQQGLADADSLRCELVPFTDAALHAWAKGRKRRKAATASLRQSNA
jgi:hypothetical protein